MSAAASPQSLTVLASAALAKYRRVKLNGSNLLAYAGASDRGLGVLNDPVLAANDPGSVLGYHEAAAIYMTASEAISREAKVYAAANGKVASTGTIEMGVALDDAAADGDVIRVAPAVAEVNAATGTNNSSYTVDADATTPKIQLKGQSGGTGNFTTILKPESTLSADNEIIVPEADGDTLAAVALAQTLTNKTLTAPTINGPKETLTVEAHTAGDTLAATESGSVHTTVGASGTVTFAMPAATVGQQFYFRVGAAQELRIDPNGSETIALPSTGVQGGAGKYLTANADGETVYVVCTKAGEWSVFGFTGTWTAEP